MNPLERLESVLVKRTGLMLRTLAPADAVRQLVRERVEALALADAAAYVEAVAADPLGDTEFGRLLTSLTNTTTSFFRHRAQFDLLRELLEARGRRRVTIWSATCASGEEAYSLAMLAADLGIDAEILGSDINLDALATARRGRYTEWSLRKLSAAYRKRYLELAGDRFRVADAVRGRVTLRHHNILSRPVPRPEHGGRWDFILCRNTFIYFSPEAIETVARRFADVIATDGWLLVGAAESLQALDVPWRAQHMGKAHAYSPSQSLLTFDQTTRGQASPTPLPQLDLRHAPFWPAPDVQAPAAAAPSFTGRPRGGTRRVVPSTRVPGNVARPMPSAEARAAQEHLDAGNEVAADAALERHLAKNPRDFAARLLRGTLALKRHDFEAAVDHYEWTVSQLPLSAEAAFLAGLAQRKLGEMERARDQLRRALFLDDRCWPAAFLLAGVYGRLGQPARRLATLRHVLEILDAAPRAPGLTVAPLGVEELALQPDRVTTLCRRYLAAEGSATG